MCDLETIGGKIRYARLQNNLTHKELGLLTGLNKQTIADCENDKLPKSIKTIDLICSALNLDPYYVYDDYLKFISGDFPVKIKAIREKLNLTRSEFRKLTGTNMIADWELGRRKPSRKSYDKLKDHIGEFMENKKG